MKLAGAMSGFRNFMKWGTAVTLGLGAGLCPTVTTNAENDVVLRVPVTLTLKSIEFSCDKRLVPRVDELCNASSVSNIERPVDLVEIAASTDTSVAAGPS
mmetsp:Transcript_86332/g.135012  ORF Transcript_86332/g.135012 Transcript_86332/m.135012 type:complete len:100 (+) Transcript_86332:92-391(+)